MNSRTIAPSHPTTRMYLDHGADESQCENFRIGEKGATFDSPWHFPLLAELSICLDYCHPRLGHCRTPVQGVVVGTHRLPEGTYETTVLFLGPPEDRPLMMDGHSVLAR